MERGRFPRHIPSGPGPGPPPLPTEILHFNGFLKNGSNIPTRIPMLSSPLHHPGDGPNNNRPMSTPTRQRMEAYWTPAGEMKPELEEYWYLPWVKNKSPIQDSFPPSRPTVLPPSNRQNKNSKTNKKSGANGSFNSSAHSIDETVIGPCFHYPKQNPSPSQPRGGQYCARPSCCFSGIEIGENDYQNSQRSNNTPPYPFPIHAGRKPKGSQRFSVNRSRTLSARNTNNNNCRSDDYGFIQRSRSSTTGPLPYNNDKNNNSNDGEIDNCVPNGISSGILGNCRTFYSNCEESVSEEESNKEDEGEGNNDTDSENVLSYQGEQDSYLHSTSRKTLQQSHDTPLDSDNSSKISRYRTFSSSSGTNSHNNSKRPSKLKRRKAYYKDKKTEGRSRSLTHIDNLDPGMLLRNEDMDSRSEPDTSHDQLLYVPNHASHSTTPTAGESRESRRKKLARSQVSSSEFFSVCFEGELGSGLEEFIPAFKGISLGDALRPLFDKKKISFEMVNVFVDSSKTPLPSAVNTDTYFVAGKNLVIRVKESKSGGSADPKFHTRSFKQPSRKSSTRTKGKFFSASTEDPGPGGSVPGTGTPSSYHGSPTHGHNEHNLLSSQSSLTNNHGPVSSLSQQGSISHEGSLKVKSSSKASSNRWSGLFSNSIKDNSKMDLLIEQLNSYSKNGIPKPSPVTSDEIEIQSNFIIEDDWKSLVSSSHYDGLSERGKQQQTAIWELVETEVVYLRTVKVITDLFLACLYNLQAANILNEIDRDQLFSNIPDIYKSNQDLWLDCIYPMVLRARENHEPLQPLDLHSGFLRFDQICQPYIRYCLDQSKCQQYCREKYHENELFKAYLAWCETRKECNRLRLMDILVRPMQRMTKYSLLLKAILKHTEELEQRKSLEEMISSVERFVKSVNGALRSRQDAEKLQGIDERIESYDVVETREDELEALIKLHSKLDLLLPMPACGSSQRCLLYEGDLKLKDSFTSKMDVHCFLFTDMLLICKGLGKKGDKMKVIRQPYIVDRVLFRELSKDPTAFGIVYLNEYGTPSAALSLYTSDPKCLKGWIDHLKKAQKLYKDAKESSLEPYTAEGILLDEESETAIGGSGVIYLNSRSPRLYGGGSSRASQLSSLVHSHSGSMEMNEGVASASNISSRGVSFEHELRGSSLSSEDGNNATNVVLDGLSGVSNVGSSLTSKQRSLSTDTSGIVTGRYGSGGGGNPGSPRVERRIFLSKSPTPNTLSVQIPVPNLSGQSLPNLNSASESLPPTYSIYSLVVPKSPLSPTHRGVSYPPPSPRNLRRSHALLQSRNPPLQKSKNILTSPEKGQQQNPKVSGVSLPEIKGVVPPSTDVSPIITQPPPTPASSNSTSAAYSPEIRRKEFFSESETTTLNSRDDGPTNLNQDDGKNIGTKKLARNERSDTKRYHTAGAIEDIKKECCKDSSIHKRLSWNYGPQQLPGNSSSSSAAHHRISTIVVDPLRNRPFFSSESMTSIRSSSGVSSTSSLLHSISDLEGSSSTTSTPQQEFHPIPPTRSGVRIDVSEPEGDSGGFQVYYDEHDMNKDRFSNTPNSSSFPTQPGSSAPGTTKLNEPTPGTSATTFSTSIQQHPKDNQDHLRFKDSSKETSDV